MKITLTTDEGEVLDVIEEIGDLGNHGEAAYLLDQIREAQKLDQIREAKK